MHGTHSQVGLVLAFSAMAARVSATVAASMFFVYAALTGVTLSTIFLIYTSGSIASAFFVTSGTFAGLSLYGATTKRELSAMGRFAVFALIGFGIASAVNLFLASTPLLWGTTFSGVLIFGALTGYDTQKLKAMHEGAGATSNLALRGALTLYLDFVNMFLLLLNFGERRRQMTSHASGASDARAESQSSHESASRTTRISFPIEEAPAAVPLFGADARRRAGTKDRVRGADSSEPWVWACHPRSQA
jgi:FtsH-binding integral membrane protein